MDTESSCVARSPRTAMCFLQSGTRREEKGAPEEIRPRDSACHRLDFALLQTVRLCMDFGDRKIARHILLASFAQVSCEQ